MKTRYETAGLDIEKSLKVVLISDVINLLLIAIVCVTSYFYRFPEWASIVIFIETFMILLVIWDLKMTPKEQNKMTMKIE